MASVHRDIETLGRVIARLERRVHHWRSCYQCDHNQAVELAVERAHLIEENEALRKQLEAMAVVESPVLKLAKRADRLQLEIDNTNHALVYARSRLPESERERFHELFSGELERRRRDQELIHHANDVEE